MTFKKGWVPSKETREKMRNAKLLNPTQMFGSDNPATRQEVRERISSSVKSRWEEGIYDSRINGMIGKTGWNHHNVKELNYVTYSRHWHEDKCYICGDTEHKIDIHHVDEDTSNFTLTNLIPLCVGCHQKQHKMGPLMTATKFFKFEACHCLEGSYSGLCDELHGHSYRFEVSIRKRLNGNDMVVDFGELKEKVNNYIVSVLDHTNLNLVLPGRTTAENIALWIWDVLEKDALVKGICKISVEETDTSRIELTPVDIMSFIKREKLSIEDRFTEG